jgi:hypothetical protein
MLNDAVSLPFSHQPRTYRQDRGGRVPQYGGAGLSKVVWLSPSVLSFRYAKDVTTSSIRILTHFLRCREHTMHLLDHHL